MPRLGEYLRTELIEDEECFSLDYSSFDRTIPAAVIEAAFGVLEQALDFTTMQCEDGTFKTLTEKKAGEYKRVFSWLKWNFINTKMMLPTGDTFRKGHGICSGSSFTSIIGTICNQIMANYYMDPLQILKQRYLGDDSSIIVKRSLSVNLTYLADLGKEVFGVKLNPQKSKKFSKGDTIDFLGYKMQNCVIVQDKMKLFRNLLYSEHRIRTLGHSIGRLIAGYYLGGVADRHYDAYLNYVVSRLLPLYPSIKPYVESGLMKFFSAVGIQQIDIMSQLTDLDPLVVAFKITT